MNELKLVGRVGGVPIALLRDVTIPHGQWIGFGASLDRGDATPLLSLLSETHRQFPEHPGWLFIPHTRDVDDLLLELYDACVAIRTNAPPIVQLVLDGLEANELP